MCLFVLQADAAVKSTERQKKVIDQIPMMTVRVRKHGLRWFVLPSEVADDVISGAPKAGPDTALTAAPPGQLNLLPRFKPDSAKSKAIDGTVDDIAPTTGDTGAVTKGTETKGMVTKGTAPKGMVTKGTAPPTGDNVADAEQPKPMGK